MNKNKNFFAIILVIAFVIIGAIFIRGLNGNKNVEDNAISVEDEVEKTADDAIVDSLNVGSQKSYSTPEVYMFFNEFVPKGGTLKVRGKNFDADSLIVGFVSLKDSVIWVSGKDVKVVSPTEAWIKVPAGVAENHAVFFRNSHKGLVSRSNILFRDTRNVLIDMEHNTKYNYFTGIVPTVDGLYDVSRSAYPVRKLIPDNYHSNWKEPYNQYALIDPSRRCLVSYAPNVTKLYLEDACVFGPFSKRSAKCCVKFEMFVPKEYALKGGVFSACFTCDYANGTQTVRSYCAPLNMSAVCWNKKDTAWTVDSCKTFYTNEWMTVTVPLEEFKWNLYRAKYDAFAKELTENKPGVPEYLYGDLKGKHRDYCYINRADIEYPEKFGGFCVTYDPADQIAPSHKFLIAIDNVRIVPYDGNGAIYPKLKYGVPSQHFYSAPRKFPFKMTK